MYNGGHFKKHVQTQQGKTRDVQSYLHINKIFTHSYTGHVIKISSPSHLHVLFKMACIM